MPGVRIKPIAMEMVGRRLPDFSPMQKKGGYWFRRESNGLYDIFVITASFKYCSVEVDIYSGVFEDWPGAYGTHLLHTGKRLDNLRYDSHAINVNDIGYAHDQTEVGIRSALEQALSDLERLALPFFATFHARLATHALIRAAYSWLSENRAGIPLTVYDDFMAELKRVGPYSMTNPWYTGLKSCLRSVRDPMITREDRKEITILVMDMLQLYSATKGNVQPVRAG